MNRISHSLSSKTSTASRSIINKNRTKDDKKKKTDNDVITIFFSNMSLIASRHEIEEERMITDIKNLYSEFDNSLISSSKDKSIRSNIQSINTILKSDNENALQDFISLFVLYYLKPYLSKDSDGFFDFTNRKMMKSYGSFLKKIYYTILNNNGDFLKLDFIYKLLLGMEENGVTGIIDIVPITDLNAITIDFIRQLEYGDIHLSEKTTIVKLSNTFLLDLIKFIKPPHTQSGGKKIHIGPKGGKYTISIKNGKKIKKYIK
jgi:hypothetical protein